MSAITRRVPPIRGVLRAADLLVGRVGRATHADRIVPFDHYRAHIAFHNPPEFNLYFRGIYEPETTTVLRRFLKPGDTAVDVGCNCGIVTLEMAAAVGDTGRVISIDPSPASVARTQRQLDANGMRHRVVHAGLDAIDGGTMRYYLTPVGIGALPASERRYTTDEWVDVPVRTLDAILVTEPPIALLKCDTDGHEGQVFRGARCTVERDRPLLYFELTPDAMARAGEDARRLIEWLDSLGYAFIAAAVGRTIKRAQFRPLTLDEARHASGNLIGYQPRHQSFVNTLH